MLRETFAEHSNLPADARVDRAGVRTEEFGSARRNLPLLDRVVQRNVMAFDSPAPRSRLGGRAEDAEVVFPRIAALTAFFADAPFEQEQHLFETHHVERLVVASRAQA